MSEETMLLEYIRDHFDTDRIERDGVFVRTVGICNNRIKVGDIAGYTKSDGYISIQIIGKCYQSHRLVFLWVNRVFPEDQIDHINGIRHDNRYTNIRSVTSKINNQNRKLPTTNTSGYCGVGKLRGGWKVEIGSGEGCFYKRFDSKIDAISCAKAKYKELGYTDRHGEPTHKGRQCTT